MNEKYNHTDIIYKVSISFILFIGILIRFFFFIQGRPFWHDECSTVINIFEKSYLGLWGVLSNLQSAPPIYLMISKLFNSIPFVSPHYTLRFFPFCCSIVAVFAFYFLTKQILQKRLPVLLANLLFAVNIQLIYYAQEFRQYSCDVLICILCLLHFSKLRIENMNLKTKILNGILLLILPFISLPSIFLIGAWVVLSLFKANKTAVKNILFIIIPSVFANILFYIFTLSPTHKILTAVFPNLDGFLSLNYQSFAHTITLNYLYFFNPCNLIIIPVILSLLGVIILIKRKEPADKLILVSILMIIAASMLHLYPIRERNALYILPMLLVLITIPAAYFKNKIVRSIVSIMIVIFMIPYINHFSKPDNILPYLREIERPDILMNILKENYKQGDIIMYNDASFAEFKVYANLCNFQMDNITIGQINAQKNYNEQEYADLFNRIPKSNIYWFYCPYDYLISPLIPYLEKWAHSNGKILYEYKDHQSYLLLLQL